MSLNSLGLGFIFSAKDTASATMAKVEGRFKSLDATSAASAAAFQKNTKMAVAGLGVAAAGAVGLGVAFGAANQYGAFEQELAKVGAITRASAADMERLRAKAIEAGMATQFSPDEAMAGLGALGARGFVAAEAMEALDGALDLAAGGQIGIEQASSTAAAALRVFGHQALQATDAADKLLKISNLTAIQAGDLELMLGSVSRGAGLTKQSLEEMAIAMGLVKNTGVDASVAASGVSSALQFISKNRKDFEKLGVAVTDAQGNFLPFIDIVTSTSQQLNDKYSNAAEKAAAATALFGKFGVTAFQGISSQVESGVRDMSGQLLKGAEAVAYLRDEMVNSSGTAAAFKDQLLDTFEGQKTILKGVGQTLAVVSGEAFAQTFKPLISILVKGLGALIALIQNMPSGLKKFVGGLFVLASALLLVAGLTIAGVAGFALLKTAVLAFSGPLIMIAKLMGGVGLAALLLLGVFKAVKAGYDRNIGGFADKLDALVAKVRLFFDAVKQLTSGDGLIRGNVLSSLLDPANESILKMVQRFQQARHRFKAFTQGLREGWDQVVTTMGPSFEALGTALQELFKAFGFGGKGVGLLTSKSEDFREKGEMMGRLIGHIAKLLIAGLTTAVRVTTGAIEGMKAAWVVLRPFVYAAGYILMSVGQVLIWLVEAFSDSTEAANKQENAWAGMAKIVGYAVGVFLVFKTALVAVRTAMLVYRAVMVGVAAVQAVFASGAAAASLAMLGPVGLVIAIGAVLAAGVAWADGVYGWSDAIANWALEVTGATAELNKLDEAYRKTIKTRGQVDFFNGLENAAKSQGMGVNEYAEQRATEISQERRARELGLSKDMIKQSLLAGEDPFDMAMGGTGKRAAGGIAAAQDGAVSATDAQAAANAKALEQVIGKDGKPIVINNTLKLGDEDLAKTMQQLDATMAALNFEADLSPTGG